ncbi:hypothetical protein LINPERHAP1_LOCUS3649, partial [Linum perenne]
SFKFASIVFSGLACRILKPRRLYSGISIFVKQPTLSLCSRAEPRFGTSIASAESRAVDSGLLTYGRSR